MKMDINNLKGDHDTFIIAEIGKNFIQSKEDRTIEEYLDNAKILIDAAIKSGVDAVKFQTHEVEDEQLDVEITSPHFNDLGRYKWVKKNTEATPMEGFWKQIKEYCDEKEIIFFSTPMSRNAAKKLETLNIPIWKVGSGDVKDYVMLDFLVSTNKPVIISSGMVSLHELDEVVEFLKSKNTQIIILYCVSRYPALAECFNLATIEYLKEKYPDITIGFSDHSIGSEVALAAVKAGARIIEKHFSISRDLWGSDHKVSMTPKEMKDFVFAVRSGDFLRANISAFYGEKGKELDGASSEFRKIFNKTLVAGRDMNIGEILNKESVFAMRPAEYNGGLPSERFYDVINKKLNKGIKKYDPIKEQYLR